MLVRKEEPEEEAGLEKCLTFYIDDVIETDDETSFSLAVALF